MKTPIQLVKVFSVTKAREREEIGDRVTAWVAANPDMQIVRTVVAQSSDASYHCLSIVVFCAAA